MRILRLEEKKKEPDITKGCFFSLDVIAHAVHVLTHDNFYFYNIHIC